MAFCCGVHPAVLRVWGGALDHAFSGATACLCMHASSTCRTTPIAHRVGPGAAFPSTLLPPRPRCRLQVHLFQLTPALQQFRLACRRPYAVTIQQVPGTPPHPAFLFLHQYYRTTSDRFRPFLEALEVVARKRFIPG